MAGKRSANVIVIDDDAATAPYVHSNTCLIMGPVDGVPVTTNSYWFGMPTEISPAVTVSRASIHPVECTEACSICLDEFDSKNPALRLHKCSGSHFFHKACITLALQSCSRCPNCMEIYGLFLGTMPNGTMSVTRYSQRRLSLDGHAGGRFCVYVVYKI